MNDQTVSRARAATPLPAYYRLQETLKDKIENGEWKPGESIPPERIIAADSRLSVGTVKKALQNLVYEGLLYRVQGKGTFVAGTTLRRGSLRYYRMMKTFNDEIAALSIKFLGIRAVDGFPAATRSLALPDREKLFRIRRVFYADGAPVVYTNSFLPCRLFSGLNELPQTLFEKTTLYEAIEKKYGLPCFYNEELFGAVPADAETAKALGLKKGAPVLYIEMRAFTYKDLPYEYRVSYCVTDRRKIFAEI